MDTTMLDLKTVSSMLPKRDPNGNKGTFGRVLLICGSKNMVGCCTLSAKGALRSGAGLVTVAFPDVLYSTLTSSLSEPLFLPLETDDRGFICYTNLNAILQEAEKADVIMVGCGIGIGYAQSLIVTSLLQSEKSLILDADALNNLVGCTELLKKASADILITPHPGEMARLINSTVDFVQQNREKVCKDFARDYNVNVLLKGSRTLICNKACTQLYVNPTGNTGLSKGGSGDLLSGIIAGLTPSLNGNLFSSASVGAFVHGFCADVLKEQMSEYSILPTDCAATLGKVFKIIETSGTD